jgi:hypothetical protein
LRASPWGDAAQQAGAPGLWKQAARREALRG